MKRTFADVHGVYNVQNHHLSGYDGEVQQGKNVVDAAVSAGVAHLVYGSAGIGTPETGIGSWETKVDVAEHARRSGVALTELRPMAFMELMTEKRFYPQASVWHVMPKLVGEASPVGWLSVDDLAVIVGKVFADRERFVGRDLALTSACNPSGSAGDLAGGDGASLPAVPHAGVAVRTLFRDGRDRHVAVVAREPHRTGPTAHAPDPSRGAHCPQLAGSSEPPLVGVALLRPCPGRAGEASQNGAPVRPLGYPLSGGRWATLANVSGA